VLVAVRFSNLGMLSLQVSSIDYFKVELQKYNFGSNPFGDVLTQKRF
jgi:hypothetical protein